MLKTLVTYHGLEPDSWNPYSSPIQTWTATEIFHEINFKEFYVTWGAVKTLFGQILFRQIMIIPTWWYFSPDGDVHTHNPTAGLAGFIIRFAKKKSDLFKLGSRLIKEAFDHFMESEIINPQALSCYIRLMQYDDKARVDHLINFNKLTENISHTRAC